MREPWKLCALVLVVFCLVSIVSGQGQPLEIDGRPVYRVGGGVSPPFALQTPDPVYPQKARKKHVEGVVLLWLVVDADGKPCNLKVVRSLEPDLDQAAIEAVQKWTFKPALKDNQPVAVQINVEVNFRLH